jgi:hypothetical protein
MKTPSLIFLLTAGLLLSAPAVEILQVPSPDNTSSLMIDKSGRRDVLQLRSGVKVVRLFYDDIDSLKPYLARAYEVPVTKLGKVTLPTYKSAKWLSPMELQIECSSAVGIGDDERDFNFTAVVDNSGKLVSATIAKIAPPPKTGTKSKPATKSKSKRTKRED